MEHTPDGTPVGVDDPYAVAGVCDHLTDDGRCRFALTRAGDDSDFAAERRADDYACHVGADGRWRACPHYRSTTNERECIRCGLEEVRIAHDAARPLVEEHHLSYGTSDRERESRDGSARGPNSDSADSNFPDSNSPDSDSPDSNPADSNFLDSNPADSNFPDSNSPDSNSPDSDSPDSDSPDSNSPDSTDGAGPHEITVALCRWCHSKVHNSFARIDDDASPDPAAVAERESRRSKEQTESAFETASERHADER